MARFLATCLLLLVSAFAQAKSIEKFTKGMEFHQGYFNFYYQTDSGKIYLQVDKLEKPFIFLSGLPQGMGSNDIGLDRGQLGGTRLVQFEQYGKRLMLKQLNTYYRANSKNQAEVESIDEAFADSIIAGLEIVASDSSQFLVDYTPFLLSDIHKVSETLTRKKQGSYKLDKNRSGVYMARTKSFPRNTELEATLTYGGSKAGQFVKQVTPEASAITVNAHHSLVALPDDGYQPRRFHPYSGYWKEEYKDYATAIDQPMLQRFIPRHRLSKADPSAAVSEAVEPIIYYLDPGVPEPVRTALYDGAMWWDQAFEAAGYKNAFQVKMLPAGADPMDVRYNVIQWVHRATRGWSYGHGVTDPRTGEIIKGHVTLGSLRVRQDFLIALGLTSPFTSDKPVTEEQKQMALARIRQLSAHEVGHTLGLAHNFAASENNRASVMDYPHPYITLKDGKISLDQAYAEGIGIWDKYTIAYGYSDFASDELQALEQLVAGARRQGLDYLSDPDARPKGSANPKGHLWDNGQDPVIELDRLSQIRRQALNQMGLNSIPKGTALSQLHQTLVPIYLLHRFQVDAVAKVVGGVHYQYELKGDYPQPLGVRTVASHIQNRAIDGLLKTIGADYLRIPEEVLALITPRAYGEDASRESFTSRNGLTFDPVSAAEAAVAKTLGLLLDPQRLNRLKLQSSQDKRSPGVETVVERVIDHTMKKVEGYDPVLSPRINQVAFEMLMASAVSDKVAPDVQAQVQYQMLSLRSWLKKAIRKHPAQKAQWSQWLRKLNTYDRTGEWKSGFKPLPLPPGSPI